LRLAAVWILIVALVALARPTPWSLALGLPFLVAGEAIRCAAAGHLAKNVELVTSGPYRFTRNPLYLGRLAIFVGLAIMAWLPWGGSAIVLALGLSVFFGYYLPRKERVEPARLAALFGERYERYRREVPALWPAFRPWPDGARRPWSYDRFAANREAWMIAGLTAIVTILAWRALL
jgi:protein-S-isoprenylcysteine O-methyltransferase Ste14